MFIPKNCVKIRKKYLPLLPAQKQSCFPPSWNTLNIFYWTAESISMNFERKYNGNHKLRSFIDSLMVKNQLKVLQSPQHWFKVAFYSNFVAGFVLQERRWMFSCSESLVINFRFSLPIMFFSTSAERQIQNYITEQFDLSEFQCLHLKIFLFMWTNICFKRMQDGRQYVYMVLFRNNTKSIRQWPRRTHKLSWI